MDFHEVWKDVVVGVVVGLFMLYQQRKISQYDGLSDRIRSLEESSVTWQDHEKALERLEDRHDQATQRIFDRMEDHHKDCLLYTSPSPRD